MSFLSPDDWIALKLTIKLALITTGLLLILATPLAWWLARSRSRLRLIVEALVSLPLVLPPTVLGFYLLLAMGPNGPLGQISLLFTDQILAFSFPGLIIGSLVYSLPFVVQPLQASFAGISQHLLDAASVYGASRWQRFRTIALPLANSGFLSAMVLGFAHTLGEFGVVLMIGGNIPGQTRVVSIALYDQVENLNYDEAGRLALILLLMSFSLLLFVYRIGRRPFMSP